MRKQYIRPNASIVTLNLIGSVLEDVVIKPYSDTTATYGAREVNHSDWDEDWDDIETDEK